MLFPLKSKFKATLTTRLDLVLPLGPPTRLGLAKIVQGRDKSIRAHRARWERARAPARTGARGCAA